LIKLEQKLKMLKTKTDYQKSHEDEPDISIWYKLGQWYRWNRYKMPSGRPTSNSIHPMKMYTIYRSGGDSYCYWDFQTGAWLGVLTINCLTQNKKMCNILCKEDSLLNGHKGSIAEYAAIRISK